MVLVAVAASAKLILSYDYSSANFLNNVQILGVLGAARTTLQWNHPYGLPDNDCILHYAWKTRNILRLSRFLYDSALECCF